VSIRDAFLRMLISRLIGVAIMAASMIILARLLEPRDFGLFALAMTGYAIARTVVEFGVPQFLIRQKDPEPSDFAAAIGLSLTIVAGILLLASGAWLLLPPSVVPTDLAKMAALLCFSLLLLPLIITIQAALQRSIDFKLLSVLAVLQILIESVVAIGLALVGFEAVALAAGFFAAQLFTVGVLVAARPPDQPLVPRFSGWCRFRTFSFRYVGIALLPHVGEMLIAAIITRVLGLAPLGIFDRANRLSGLLDKTILEGIKPVVLPAISRSLEAGKEPARIYLVKLDYLTVSCWPAFALIALLAEPLVLVLLGDGWAVVTDPLRILCIMGLFIPITKMSMKLFVALDMMTDYLKIQALHQALRVVLAFGGAMISLEWVCVGMAGALATKALMVTVAVWQRTRYSHQSMLLVIARALCVVVLTLAGPAALLIFSPGLAAWIILVLSLPLAGCGWLAGVALTRHRLLREALGVLRLRRGAFV
jgi:O-antigen/teichoic acid export membrane protein